MSYITYKIYKVFTFNNTCQEKYLLYGYPISETHILQNYYTIFYFL